MDFPDVDQSLLTTLPPVLRAVVRALGFARAQEWLKDHGGVNVHVALRPTRTLGLDDDEHARLAFVLEPHLDVNRRFWCPKADKLLILSRNAAILQSMHRESIAKQARTYNLSSRHITNIRRKVESGQLDLFD